MALDLDGSASVADGCTGEVRYQWSRDAAVVRPWSTDPHATDTVQPAPATYTLEVACFGDPQCTGVSSASFDVEPLEDLVPPPLGATLRAAKSLPRDVRISWGDLTPAGTAGGYQLLVIDADLTREPDPTEMDAATALGEAAPGSESLLHEGALDSPCSTTGMTACKLLFYKVRATSPCSAVPGPTCNGFPAQVPCP
jgi:hypothetical protein